MWEFLICGGIVAILVICAIIWHRQFLKYREARIDAIETELSYYQAERLKELNDTYENLTFQLDQSYTESKLECDAIQYELQKFKSERRALNEALRNERAIQNSDSNFKLILSEDAKLDIEFLLQVESRLSNKEPLRKLIWSEYLLKPFNAMLKDQFGAEQPANVIYCIENLDTHKKYIGKTCGKVGDRWSAHIKSSLGIGTISHQLIHEALLNNWDKFSFYIIEAVPADQNLGEREKFYINMFESDKYGYNIASGG